MIAAPRLLLALSPLALAVACGGSCGCAPPPSPDDAGDIVDASRPPVDASVVDASEPDAGTPRDAGPDVDVQLDGGRDTFTPPLDAGYDAGWDAGYDGGWDAGPPPVWTGYTPQCPVNASGFPAADAGACPEIVGVPWERSHAPSVPADAPWFPQFLWSRDTLCDGATGLLGAVDTFTAGDPDVAVTRITHESSQRDVVVSALHPRASAFGLTYAPWSAVATIDANTGETIGCAPIEEGRELAGGIRVSGETGAFFAAANLAVPDGGPGVNLVRGTLPSGPVVEQPLTEASSAAVAGAHGLTIGPAGVVVSVFEGDAVLNSVVGASADALQPRWTVTGCQLGAWSPCDSAAASQAGEQRISGAIVSAVSGAPPSLERRVRVVDRCGQPGADVVTSTSRFLDHRDLVLYNIAGNLRIESAGVLVHEETDCGGLVQADAERFVCSHRLEDRIVFLDVSGETVTRTSVPVPPWDVVFDSPQGAGTLVAAGDGRVLAQRSIWHDGLLRNRIDAIAPDGTVAFTLRWDRAESTSGSLLPSFITPTGVLVVAQKGHLTAWQTDLPGLAHTRWPRGYRGGNENRGAVDCGG